MTLFEILVVGPMCLVLGLTVVGLTFVKEKPAPLTTTEPPQPMPKVPTKHLIHDDPF